MRTYLLTVVPLLVFGCSNSSSQSDMGADMSMPAVEAPHNYTQIAKLINQTTPASHGLCAVSSCHSAQGAAAAGGLNLSADPFGQLVNKAAENAKAKGEGLMRVKPCDKAHSLLYIKLTLPDPGSASVGYGERMPASNNPLPQNVIAAIGDWIDRGALMNEPDTVTGHTCQVDGGTL